MMQETAVTDSYLTLDQNIRKCQNQESYDNCTTKYLLENLKIECGCLPFTLSNFDKVPICQSFAELKCIEDISLQSGTSGCLRLKNVIIIINDCCT